MENQDNYKILNRLPRLHFSAFAFYSASFHFVFRLPLFLLLFRLAILFLPFAMFLLLLLPLPPLSPFSCFLLLYLFYLSDVPFLLHALFLLLLQPSSPFSLFLAMLLLLFLRFNSPCPSLLLLPPSSHFSPFFLPSFSFSSSFIAQTCSSSPLHIFYSYCSLFLFCLLSGLFLVVFLFFFPLYGIDELFFPLAPFSTLTSPFVSFIAFFLPFFFLSLPPLSYRRALPSPLHLFYSYSSLHLLSRLFLGVFLLFIAQITSSFSSQFFYYLPPSCRLPGLRAYHVITLVFVRSPKLSNFLLGGRWKFHVL